MERIKNIKLRTDNSEIIPYTIESIPIYAMREKQSSYHNILYFSERYFFVYLSYQKRQV